MRPHASQRGVAQRRSTRTSVLPNSGFLSADAVTRSWIEFAIRRKAPDRMAGQQTCHDPAVTSLQATVGQSRRHRAPRLPSRARLRRPGRSAGGDQPARLPLPLRARQPARPVTPAAQPLREPGCRRAPVRLPAPDRAAQETAAARPRPRADPRLMSALPGRPAAPVPAGRSAAPRHKSPRLSAPALGFSKTGTHARHAHCICHSEICREMPAEHTPG